MFHFVLFFAISPPAFATIQSSCNAWYEVQVLSSIQGNKTSEQVGQFSARRGCGDNVPNRCRSRARDAAHTCMQTHWNNRFDIKKPVKCTSEGVRNYRITDLKTNLENAACSLLKSPFDYNGDTRRIVFAVYRVTQGDTNCGKRREIWDNYVKTCRCPFGKACGGE